MLTLNFSSFHVTHHSDGHTGLPKRTELVGPNAQNSLAMLLQISVSKKKNFTILFMNEFYSLYVYNLIVIQ